jgi:hypothetical protein
MIIKGGTVMGEQLSTLFNRKVTAGVLAATCVTATACGGSHEVASTTTPTTTNTEVTPSAVPSPSAVETTGSDTQKQAATTFLEQLKGGRTAYLPAEKISDETLKVLTVRAGDRIVGKLAVDKACTETTSVTEEKKNFKGVNKELNLIYTGDDPDKGVADLNRAVVAVKNCLTYRGETLMQDGQSTLGRTIKKELTSLYSLHSTDNSGVLNPTDLTKYTTLWKSAKLVKPHSVSAARTTIENSMLNYQALAESGQENMEEIAAAAEQKVVEYNLG